MPGILVLAMPIAFALNTVGLDRPDWRTWFVGFGDVAVATLAGRFSARLAILGTVAGAVVFTAILLAERLHDLQANVLHALARIATGVPLSEGERSHARRTEAGLRDRLRNPGLLERGGGSLPGLIDGARERGCTSNCRRKGCATRRSFLRSPTSCATTCRGW